MILDQSKRTNPRMKVGGGGNEQTEVKASEKYIRMMMQRTSTIYSAISIKYAICEFYVVLFQVDLLAGLLFTFPLKCPLFISLDSIEYECFMIWYWMVQQKEKRKHVHNVQSWNFTKTNNRTFWDRLVVYVCVCMYVLCCLVLSIFFLYTFEFSCFRVILAENQFNRIWIFIFFLLIFKQKINERTYFCVFAEAEEVNVFFILTRNMFALYRFI